MENLCVLNPNDPNDFQLDPLTRNSTHGVAGVNCNPA